MLNDVRMMRTNMGSFPFVVSSVSMDLGSDVDHCGILTAIVQVAIDGHNGHKARMSVPACTGQQLIPDPCY